MEIGLYTFADVSLDPDGVGPARRLREVVEEIALADEVGLDVFGVGEHHRRDYAASAPAVILASGAERSSRIRLTSAVSVLSSDDPVRVFQQFATADVSRRPVRFVRITLTAAADSWWSIADVRAYR